MSFGTADAGVVEALVARRGVIGAAEAIAGSCSWIAWDPDRGTLSACRDRLGLCSLYYAATPDLVVFGSLATSVGAAAGLDREPDPASIAAHLQGRYPAPGRSYLRGVAAVPPAHLLEVTASSLRPRRYWHLAPCPAPIPAAEAASEVERLLRSVVAETMPAEGCALTLSSGLDTSTLALFWRRVHPAAPLDALLWAAPELPQADEWPVAHQVGEALRLRCHTVAADRLWPLSASGAPLTRPDSPLVPFYAELWDETYRRARQLGGRILVTGAGGDHLFGYGGFGAYTYVDLLIRGRWRELVRQVRRHAAGSPASWRRIVDRDLLRPVAHLLLPRWRPRRRWLLPWLGPSARRELDRPAGRGSAAGWALPSRRHRHSILTDPGLAPMLNCLGERARCHGLELRHPLLDHRLIELAVRLPGEACFEAGSYKVVLRNLLRPHLPAGVVERRSKVSPEAIFDRGLRERQVAQTRELLTGMEAARRGWVDEDALRSFYSRYQEGRENGSRLWFALTLEHWLRRYF